MGGGGDRGEDRERRMGEVKRGRGEGGGVGDGPRGAPGGNHADDVNS